VAIAALGAICTTTCVARLRAPLLPVPDCRLDRSRDQIVRQHLKLIEPDQTRWELNNPGVPRGRPLWQIVRSAKAGGVDANRCRTAVLGGVSFDALSVRSGCVVRGQSIRCADTLIDAVIQTEDHDIEPALLFALAHEHAHVLAEQKGELFIQTASLRLTGDRRARHSVLREHFCRPHAGTLESEQQADDFALESLIAVIDRLPIPQDIEARLTVVLQGTQLDAGMVRAIRLRTAARQLIRAANAVTLAEPPLAPLLKPFLAEPPQTGRAAGVAAASGFLCAVAEAPSGIEIPAFTRSTHPQAAVRLARAYKAIMAATPDHPLEGSLNALDDHMFRIEAAMAVNYADYVDALEAEMCRVLARTRALPSREECSSHP